MQGPEVFLNWVRPMPLPIQTAIFTRKGCERVMRYAFNLAQKRKKLGKKPPVGMVTNCSKSNALNYSMVFWDSVYRDVAKDYPDIKPMEPLSMPSPCGWSGHRITLMSLSPPISLEISLPILGLCFREEWGCRRWKHQPGKDLSFHVRTDPRLRSQIRGQGNRQSSGIR